MTILSKRHWFRFSLRTMFVVVTILAIPLGYLGWQINIVRERKAILAELRRAAGNQGIDVATLEMAEEKLGSANLRARKIDMEYLRVSRIRRILGDASYYLIRIRQPLESNLIGRMEVAFPESNLQIEIEQQGSGWTESRDSLYKPATERKPNFGTIFKTGLIEKATTAPTP